MKISQILFPLIIVGSVFTPARAQGNPQATHRDSKELIGSYGYTTGFVGASYAILADGKYEYSTWSDCCDSGWRESGNYTLKDNLLHFRIIRKTFNEYDPKQATAAYWKIYSRITEVPAFVIKPEYDMQVVRWGERTYLVDPAEINLFAAAVNFGIEPRTGTINKYFAGEFFLRNEDMRKAVTGKPELPERWRPYLQDSPTRASVTKVEISDHKERYKEETYTVNKGAADGVRVGMFFLNENTKPDYFCLLKVIYLEEHSAIVKGEGFGFLNYEVGEFLVTKITKNPR